MPGKQYQWAQLMHDCKLELAGPLNNTELSYMRVGDKVWLHCKKIEKSNDDIYGVSVVNRKFNIVELLFAHKWNLRRLYDRIEVMCTVEGFIDNSYVGIVMLNYEGGGTNEFRIWAFPYEITIGSNEWLGNDIKEI